MLARKSRSLGGGPGGFMVWLHSPFTLFPDCVRNMSYNQTAPASMILPAIMDCSSFYTESQRGSSSCQFGLSGIWSQQ